MGRRATITKAQISRALQAAREADPTAVIEVTASGTIRILPGSIAQPIAGSDDVEAWFDQG